MVVTELGHVCPRCLRRWSWLKPEGKCNGCGIAASCPKCTGWDKLVPYGVDVVYADGLGVNGGPEGADGWW